MSAGFVADTAVCGYAAPGSSPRDDADMGAGEGDTLHERLVAYVHSVAGGARRGVWGEHSYARARAGAGGAPRVRALLAPSGPEVGPRTLDVVGVPSPPPSPPGPARRSPSPSHTDDTDASDDGEWEARVAALAPDALHARLADHALDMLRRMRLARRVARGREQRREQAREAARRLRRALAPLWTGSGAAGWLHAALLHHLPRAERCLYEEALTELRRRVPRLAARMTGVRGAPAPEVGVAGGAAAVGPESSPWLVWVSSGCAALDARWEPRLAALVHTRVLRGAGGAGEAAGPEAWCGAAAAAVRGALTDALAEAGSRAVVLGGAGAGCAVALVLARGAGGAGRAEGGVRGCVLAAPPLLTAEGARDSPDDALPACRLPLLLVAGTHAADCARHIANNVCERGSMRRLLEVRGADDALRLPARLRARHRLPQHALDAALVEECVRWAIETAELEEESPSPPTPPAAPRRAPLPAVVREIDLTEEEYAHLPPAEPEARVVSRVSGATPLPLAPPRRVPVPPAPPAPLAADDIMQLPIVFADDAASPPSPAPASLTTASSETAAPPPSPLTVTSGHPTKRGSGGEESGSGGAGGGGADAGSVKFTRVILAKRGARRAEGGGTGGGEGARRLLLRRGVRLVPRRVYPSTP